MERINLENSRFFLSRESRSSHGDAGLILAPLLAPSSRVETFRDACPVFTSLYFRVDRSLVVIPGTRGRDLHGKREIYIASLWFEYTRVCTLCKKKKRKKKRHIRDIRELFVRVARTRCAWWQGSKKGWNSLNPGLKLVRKVRGWLRMVQYASQGWKFSEYWEFREFWTRRNEDDNYIWWNVCRVCDERKKRGEERRESSKRNEAN